jgi:co-chaperonin GroES (HSP10)
MRLCDRERELTEDPCRNVASVRWCFQRGARDLCADCARKAIGLDCLDQLSSLLRPLGDRVVILPETVDAYKGRLVLPATYKPKLEHGMGVILAAGPGATYRKRLTDAHWALDLAPMTSRVGDRVIYRRKHEGVVHDWRGLIVCHDFDVLAVVEQEEVAA